MMDGAPLFRGVRNKDLHMPVIMSVGYLIQTIYGIA